MGASRRGTPPTLRFIYRCKATVAIPMNRLCPRADRPILDRRHSCACQPATTNFRRTPMRHQGLARREAGDGSLETKVADFLTIRFACTWRRAIRLPFESRTIRSSRTPEFRWKTPAPNEDTSNVVPGGDGVDYYFVYGPSMDRVIAGYRLLTGKATMLPDWAFGLWQSRQRYETGQQSLDVVKEFRARKIPFDNIVQDWQYWHVDAWGSHMFDPTRFPIPTPG